MKYSLRLEEAALTAAAIWLLSQHHLGLSLWLWIPLFFAPDIGMIGYLHNPRTGALTYNLFHHKGIAIAVAATGYFLQHEILLAAGLLLFAHACFDRILGYGLKYPDSFHNTHLGQLKKVDR
jgi:hypothetical protein